jgi:drug/metabolite transporter superfamily protein YnfA
LGLGIVWVTTHGLAHLVVGRLQGMRFTHWFIGEITLPQPGVKVDYATYLTVPAHRRAWMHASGAIMSKVVPFALIPAAVASEQPTWVIWAVAAFGAISVLTDIAWSTKVSDWKKYRREMDLASGG